MKRAAILLALAATACVAIALPDFEWTETHERIGEGATKTTYLSPVMNLKHGECANTRPPKTPLKFPTGKYAITDFRAEVVNGKNESVPLDKIYNHHWIIFDGHGNAGPYPSLNFVFGVGAESRNTPVSFPSPYAFVTRGTERWNANIHLLNTIDVPNVKDCIECRCPDGTGRIKCCPDGFVCPTNDVKMSDPEPFYLRYEVTWEEIKPTTIPVAITILDVAKGAIEYDTYPGEGGQPPRGTPLNVSYVVPEDRDVVWGVGHQHNGAIRIDLSVNGKIVCSSLPREGTGHEAGNEEGYVVAISECDFHDAPMRVHKGDLIEVVSYYRTDMPYRGVMGLFTLATAAPQE